MRFVYVFLFSVALLIGVSACSPLTKTSVTESMYVEIGDDSSFYPNFDWLAYRGMESKLRKLGEEDFSIAVGTVIDQRVPQSYVYDVESDRVIHEYDPDAFLQNAGGFVQNLLQSNLKFGRPKHKVYVADVVLKHMRLRILKGNLLAGRWGRYAIDVEMDVTVRDYDGVVLEKTPITIKHVQRRLGAQGRQPSERQDRARMVSAFRESFRPLGVELAWKVRRAHARRRGGDIAD